MIYTADHGAIARLQKVLTVIETEFDAALQD
jgi:hypothetical protein